MWTLGCLTLSLFQPEPRSPGGFAFVEPLVGADFSLPAHYGMKEPDLAGPKTSVWAAPGRRWQSPSVALSFEGHLSCTVSAREQV